MPPPMHFGDGLGTPLELVPERLTGCANSPTNSLMNFLNFKGSLVVLFVTVLGCLAAASASTTNTPTPKPSPKDGERGTVSYWQKELPGKSKRDIKAMLGTPQTIAEQGAVYNYPGEFFHPDLDEWRALLIRFDQADLAESFTGEGSDTKTYKIEAPPWQQTADATGVPTGSPSPSPSPTPNIEAVKEQVQASVGTVEMTEQPLGNSGAGATAFIFEFNGKKFITTNIHVLEGEAATEIQLAWHHGPRPGAINSPRIPSLARVKTSFEVFQRELSKIPPPTIKSSSGQLLTPSRECLLSEGRDIAMFPTTTALPALIPSTEQPKRGQNVVIVGNPEAGHTLAALEAEITNVGPDRFELDRVRGGEIVGGMSGSPVVDVATGKVLGIITYGTERKKWIGDEVHTSAWGTQVVPMFEVQKRFFAYRCDNLVDLQQFTWAQFVNDCLILNAMRERTLSVFWASSGFSVASGNGTTKELTPDFDNKAQMTYSSFVKDAQRFIGSSDFDFRVRRWQEYQRKLETLLQTDLVDPRYPIVTPYIRRELNSTVSTARREVIHKLREEAGKVQ